MRVRFASWLVVLVGLGVVGLLAGPAAADDGDYRQVVDITFPTDPPSDQTPLAVIDGTTYGFIDDYYYSRGNTYGIHRATDIFGHHGQKVYAARSGRVAYIPGEDGNPPRWGYMLSIEGDDGRTYHYIHLGRQDGPPSGAYAEGITEGVRVERGQHIGYLGSSGNASASLPHLHFEIEDASVAGSNQWGAPYINPYYSLKDAIRRGDLPGATGPFFDIAGNNHEDDILELYERGLTTGCSERAFCPWDSVTREQMAAFLVRALDLDPADEHPFEDVEPDSPRKGDIAALAEAGITKGCTSEEAFCPKEPVTRAQMASFIVRAWEIPEGEPANFQDVPPDRNNHSEDIDALFAAGITKGCTQDQSHFCPSREIPRAQMASFLIRTLDDWAEAP